MEDRVSDLPLSVFESPCFSLCLLVPHSLARSLCVSLGFPLYVSLSRGKEGRRIKKKRKKEPGKKEEERREVVKEMRKERKGVS